MTHHESPHRASSRDTKRAKTKEEKWREGRRGEHVLHPSLCFKTFVLLLIRCPHVTVLLDVVGLDHMAVMDVDVAAGWCDPTCVPRTNGSARSAVLGTGGVVRTADTVRSRRKSTS